jgi:hypothetical protein
MQYNLKLTFTTALASPTPAYIKLVCAHWTFFLPLATMQTFRKLLIAAAAISVHIATVEACISATTDLDGRNAPASNATRTTDVYLTGDCIDGTKNKNRVHGIVNVLSIVFV